MAQRYDPLYQQEEVKGPYITEIDSLPYQRAEISSSSDDVSPKRRTPRSCLLIFSFLINILLFMGLLFVLAKPCYFSDRACRYDKGELEEIPANEQVKGTKVHVGYAGEGFTNDEFPGLDLTELEHPTNELLKSMGDEEKIPSADSSAMKPSGGSIIAGSNATGLPLMGDVNGIVPQFTTEKVVFMNDSRYANEDMFTNETEYESILAQWHEDMPIGRGFVVVDNSTNYPYLQRPWTTNFGNGDGYSIASLHQLHCLYMILSYTGDLAFGRIEGAAAALSKATYAQEKTSKHHKNKHGKHKGNAKAKGYENAAGLNLIDRDKDADLETFRQSLEDDVPTSSFERREGHHHKAEDRARHVTHCFDYLRQSARCAGDATLEGKSSMGIDMTDGWGDTHICKKNTEVWDWVVQNRFSDKHGID